VPEDTPDDGPLDIPGEQTDPEVPGTSSPAGGQQGGGFHMGLLWAFVPALLFLLLLLAWRRVGRDPTTPESAYLRLRLAGRAAGISARPEATPYEYARLLGSRWPEAGEGAWRIADWYVRNSYSGGKAIASERDAAAAGWRSIRALLLKRLLRRP